MTEVVGKMSPKEVLYKANTMLAELACILDGDNENAEKVCSIIQLRKEIKVMIKKNTQTAD
ncbi:hypothetical protein [Spartinivicinus poritis]|uniref:Uncharacterized protein n=1 Tax=Spartinivicinus poritis TaxID=2994640 RepID=A0ABT5UGK4_9GAMM|nr:hypothetical protein [Spartinivicinus sp. A2-2]MDE1465520.1 hypothetical protein [Spartinivicinus sp. A2-2]